MPTDRPTPVTRQAEGRWLGGVCRGLAEARDLDLVWLRLGFVALGLLGGIGAVLYIACWLIMPSEADAAGERAGGRGAVWLAQACAACVGMLVLAVMAAVATVFGFGWIVFAVAATVLIGVLAVRRLGPGWALLPVAALALPSVAVAAGGLSLTTQTGARVVDVTQLSQLDDHTYRSGLDTMLIDLRHTPLTGSDATTLHVHAGLRRTIVALPENACVHVAVHAHVNGFPLRMASLLSGRSDSAFGDLFLFGRLFGARSPVSVTAPGHAAGPTLTIDFDSEGGSLYVRDYPDRVDPDLQPDWPGDPDTREVRPITTGMTRQGAQHVLSAWQARNRDHLVERQRVLRLDPGPCAAS